MLTADPLSMRNRLTLCSQIYPKTYKGLLWSLDTNRKFSYEKSIDMKYGEIFYVAVGALELDAYEFNNASIKVVLVF